MLNEYSNKFICDFGLLVVSYNFLDYNLKYG